MKSKELIDGLDKMIQHPTCPLNYSKDYELLLAVMLSAQTTDERVNKVTSTLFKFSLEELINLSDTEIENILRPLGNMKKKTMYVKGIASKLLNESNGIVPDDRAFLESLPGVGHKTANVVLNVLFNEPTFAVDTHVYRVSKRLEISDINDDVIATEEKLMNFFPKEKWGKLHHQLVLFGRHICKSQKPECLKCEFYHKCKETVQINQKRA